MVANNDSLAVVLQDAAGPMLAFFKQDMSNNTTCPHSFQHSRDDGSNLLNVISEGNYLWNSNRVPLAKNRGTNWKNMESKEHMAISGSTEEQQDQPYHAERNVTESKSILQSLGDHPSPEALANVAALRANEYIIECISTEVSPGKVDREVWERIPQFTKQDLIVGQHLGKGTFSDVFEVIVKATKKVETPALESLDVESSNLNKLISQKIQSVGSDLDKQGIVEKDDSNSTLNNRREEDMCIDDPQGSEVVSSEHQKSQAQVGESNTHRICAPRRHTATGEIFGLGPADIDKTRSYRSQSINEGITGMTTALGSVHTRNCRTLAMKCLRPKTRSSMDQFMIGVEDLVNETAMLASINHPNIITLHGRAGGCTMNTFRLSDGYFILLDRLRDTLDDRILSWKKTLSINNRTPSMPSMNQLKVACAIADAMSYLHSKNIVFRDLKPANVGFDGFGVLKLFDFGFAKYMDITDDHLTTSSLMKSGSSSEKSTNDDNPPHYLRYERCGTVRYMAPEVGLQTGHGISADVYSFGIVLWEICSLKKPYDNIKSACDFDKYVFEKGERPKLLRGWSTNLKSMLTSCWSTSANERPTMLDVVAKIHQCVQEVEVIPNSQKCKRSFSFQRGRNSFFGNLHQIHHDAKD